MLGNGIGDLTMQMVIKAREELQGLDVTLEKIEDLKRTSRNVTDACIGYFKKMKSKIQVYFASMSGAITRFNNAVRKISMYSKIAFFAIATFTGLIGKSIIGLASTAQEMDSKFKKVFGDLSKGAERWAKSYSRAVGLSVNWTTTAMGSIQSLAVGFGFAREEGYKLSKMVVTLSQDLASFNKLDADHAMNNLISVMQGQTLAGRSLNVATTQTNLERAGKLLGVTYNKNLPEAIKMLVRYTAVLQQSEDAIGDKLRTQDSYANQLVRLKGVYEDIKTELGKGFIPTLTKGLMLMNNVDWGKIVNTETAVELGKMNVGLLAVIGGVAGLTTALSLLSNPFVLALSAGTVFYYGMDKIYSNLSDNTKEIVGVIGDSFVSLFKFISNYANKSIANVLGHFGKGILLNPQLQALFGAKTINTFLKTGKLPNVNTFKESEKGYRDSAEYITNVSTEQLWDDIKGGTQAIYDKGEEELGKFLEYLKGGFIKIGDSVTDAIREKIANLPTLGKGDDYYVQKTIDGYVKDVKELMNNLLAKGLTGGSAKDGIEQAEKFSDKTIQERLKIIEDIGNTLDTDKIQIYQQQLKEIEGEIAKIVETANGTEGLTDEQSTILDDLIRKYIELTNTMKDTEALDILKDKIQGLFRIDPTNISKTYNESLLEISKQLVGEKVNSSLENNKVEDYKKIQEEINALGLDSKVGSDLEKTAKEYIEAKEAELGLVEKLKDGKKEEVTGTYDLINAFDRLGQYIQSDFITTLASVMSLIQGMSGDASLLGNIQGLGGFSDMLGGAGSFLSGVINSPMVQGMVGGLGIATAGIGIAKALGGFASRNDAERNQKELEKYEEQNAILEEGNKILERVDDSINGIYNGLVAQIGKNPTINNITSGSKVLGQMYDAIRDNYNIGNFSFVEEYKKKSFWKTRRKYTTRTLGDESLYDMLGLGSLSGPIEGLSLLELKGISNILGKIDNNMIEDLVKTGSSDLLGSIVKSAFVSAGKYTASYLASSAGILSLDLMGVLIPINPVISAGALLATILTNGLQGTLEGIGDMLGSLFGDIGTSIWGFSSWKFRRIKDNNAKELKAQIDKYIEVLENLIDMQMRIFDESTLEGFEGVELQDKNSLREQYEGFYKDLGLDPKNFTADIDKMVEENKVLISVMEDVRSTFIETFGAGGVTMGEAFSQSLDSLFSKMKNNIVQVLYDTILNDLNSQTEDFFTEFTYGLLNIKKTGADVFTYVDDFFSRSAHFTNLAESILDAKRMEETFDYTLELLEEKLKTIGATEVEIQVILDPQIEQDIKNALSSAMNSALAENEFNVFEQTLGEGIYNSVKDSLIRAFMEGEAYKGLIEKYFDLESIKDSLDNAQTFQDAYNIIDAQLSALKTNLESQGLAFDKTDATMPSQGYTSAVAGSDGSSYGISNSFEDVGGGTIINEYHISVSGNNIYGDSQFLKQFVSRVREEIARAERLES